MSPVRELLAVVSVVEQAATDKAVKPAAPIAIAHMMCDRIGACRKLLFATGIVMNPIRSAR